MFRFVAAIAATTFVFYSENADASVLVDLNSLNPSGELHGPCYCGASGPIYSYYGTPGQTVDFGTVELFWTGVAYHGLPEYYNQNWPWPGYNVFIRSQVNSNSTPSQSLWATYDTAFCPIGDNCALPSAKYELSITLPSNGFVQFGWFWPYDYLPPDQVAAVPEPSTWAMMLLGLGGIYLIGRRRFQQCT